MELILLCGAVALLVLHWPCLGQPTDPGVGEPRPGMSIEETLDWYSIRSSEDDYVDQLFAELPKESVPILVARLDSAIAEGEGSMPSHLGSRISPLVKKFAQYRTQLSPQIRDQAVTSMIAGMEKYPLRHVDALVDLFRYHGLVVEPRLNEIMIRKLAEREAALPAMIQADEEEFKRLGVFVQDPPDPKYLVEKPSSGIKPPPSPRGAAFPAPSPATAVARGAWTELRQFSRWAAWQWALLALAMAGACWLAIHRRLRSGGFR
jgi:hypothetical protein